MVITLITNKRNLKNKVHEILGERPITQCDFANDQIQPDLTQAVQFLHAMYRNFKNGNRKE